jgi:hypothetical protein
MIRKNLCISMAIAVLLLLAVPVLPALAQTGASDRTGIPTNALASSPEPLQAKPADFALDDGTPEICGLTCRQTNATITNTGDETAHKVSVVLTLFNGRGDQIALNDGPDIQRSIGDLAGGQSKSEQITIHADCGFLAFRCAGQTLILKREVRSDEKTVQFPDRVFAG